MKKSPWDTTPGEFRERQWRPVRGQLPIAQEWPSSRTDEKGLRIPPESGVDPIGKPPGSRLEGKSIEQMGVCSLADLYEEATGEKPGEVTAFPRGFLFETSVVGEYDQCPNGYLAILLCRAPHGWVVFDTGQSAPRLGVVPDPLLRDGDVLYLEAADDPESVRLAIRTMVRSLRYLTEGTHRP